MGGEGFFYGALDRSLVLEKNPEIDKTIWANLLILLTFFIVYDFCGAMA